MFNYHFIKNLIHRKAIPMMKNYSVLKTLAFDNQTISQPPTIF